MTSTRPRARSQRVGSRLGNLDLPFDKYWGDPAVGRPTGPGGSLRAFGLEASGAAPDHACTELELASLLALKEAHARSEGWRERAELVRDAYRQLLAAHLLRWLPRFAARVREAAPDSFHAAAARALDLLLRAGADRLGLVVVDAPVEHARDDEPFDCAGACALAGAARP